MSHTINSNNQSKISRVSYEGIVLGSLPVVRELYTFGQCVKNLFHMISDYLTRQNMRSDRIVQSYDVSDLSSEDGGVFLIDNQGHPFWAAGVDDIDKVLSAHTVSDLEFDGSSETSESSHALTLASTVFPVDDDSLSELGVDQPIFQRDTNSQVKSPSQGYIDLGDLGFNRAAQVTDYIGEHKPVYVDMRTLLKRVAITDKKLQSEEEDYPSDTDTTATRSDIDDGDDVVNNNYSKLEIDNDSDATDTAVGSDMDIDVDDVVVPQSDFQVREDVGGSDRDVGVTSKDRNSAKTTPKKRSNTHGQNNKVWDYMRRYHGTEQQARTWIKHDEQYNVPGWDG